MKINKIFFSLLLSIFCQKSLTQIYKVVRLKKDNKTIVFLYDMHTTDNHQTTFNQQQFEVIYDWFNHLPKTKYVIECNKKIYNNKKKLSKISRYSDKSMSKFLSQNPNLLLKINILASANDLKIKNVDFDFADPRTSEQLDPLYKAFEEQRSIFTSDEFRAANSYFDVIKKELKMLHERKDKLGHKKSKALIEDLITSLEKACLTWDSNYSRINSITNVIKTMLTMLASEIIKVQFADIPLYLSVFEALENHNQIIVHIGGAHAQYIIDILKKSFGFEEKWYCQSTMLSGKELSEVLRNIFSDSQEKSSSSFSSSSSSSCSVSSSSTSSFKSKSSFSFTFTTPPNSSSSFSSSSSSSATPNTDSSSAPCCNRCKKKEQTGIHLKKCSRCKQVWYCSIECQRLDWQTHSSNCRQPETKS